MRGVSEVVFSELLLLRQQLRAALAVVRLGFGFVPSWWLVGVKLGKDWLIQAQASSEDFLFRNIMESPGDGR
jgi:hypothetical protein